MTRTRFAKTPGRLFMQYEGIIHDRANSFASTTGISADEFISEGYVIFMESIPKWDGSKASFGTWLYRRLTQGFSTFARKSGVLRDAPDSMPSEYGDENTSRILEFKELVQSLSTEARHVAQIILNGPAEALGIIGATHPRMLRGSLRRHMKKQGCSDTTIRYTFDEIKEALLA